MDPLSVFPPDSRRGEVKRIRADVGKCGDVPKEMPARTERPACSNRRTRGMNDGVILRRDGARDVRRGDHPDHVC